jgi:hypothetical protein
LCDACVLRAVAGLVRAPADTSAGTLAGANVLKYRAIRQSDSQNSSFRR